MNDEQLPECTSEDERHEWQLIGSSKDELADFYKCKHCKHVTEL